MLEPDAFSNFLEANIRTLRNGFAFAGANAYRVNKIVPVKELIASLLEEYENAVKARAPADGFGYASLE